jgi:hypothetical protein
MQLYSDGDRIKFRDLKFIFDFIEFTHFVDLIKLSPTIIQGEQHRLANYFTQTARKEKIPPVGKIFKIIFVIPILLAHDIARSKTARKCSPRQSHNT